MPLSSSHQMVTRIREENIAEFIFEGINLPFDDANNDGYVLFKIKTLPTLTVGQYFDNQALIYFDYNAPIETNYTLTFIQALDNADFSFADQFTLFPNPAGSQVNVKSKNGIAITSISLYSMTGQLVQTQLGALDTVDVSALQSGTYIIKVHTENGTASTRFVKK